MNEASRKWLYNNLTKKGYNVGKTYDDFAHLMDTNEQSRRWAYDRAKELGYNVGKDFEQFNSLIGPDEAPAPAAVQNEAPEQPNPAQPIQVELPRIPTAQEKKRQQSAVAGAQVGLQQATQAAQQPQQPVATAPEQPKEEPKKPEEPQPAEDEAPAGNGWKPSAQQMAGLTMPIDDKNARLSRQQEDFATRMENMRRATQLGSNSRKTFNPATGQMEAEYYTTAGNIADNPLDQVTENEKTEATSSEEGRERYAQRRQAETEQRINSAISRVDPDNVAETVWQQAEEAANEEFRQYLENQNKPTGNRFLDIMAEIGRSNVATATQTGIAQWASNLKQKDLQRLADKAWDALGPEKQSAMTNEIAQAIKPYYSDKTDEEIKQIASDMAREQSDNRMVQLAIEKNAPQDAVDYFLRKAVLGTSVAKLMESAARVQAGTTGDWAAREYAEQEFENKGNKAVGLAGTVTSFAIDPITWAAAGFGGAAVRGAAWLGGRMVGEAVMNRFMTTLGGRLLAGTVGGAANFATFEAGGEAVEQLRWGGHRDETGEVGDYSAGAVGERFLHGLGMGAVTGAVAPLLGNVSDKLVRATDNTAAKVAYRTGELAVGTLAEGTIFSVPEWVDGSRDAMDVWTDNMAMIAAFRIHHGIKSAPRVIAELAKSPGTTKAGFETRLRTMLDGRPDLALTKDEQEELRNNGYSDLNELFEEYKTFEEGKNGDDNPIVNHNRRIGKDIPYNRFSQLMNDGRISEAARAKMYYYLTGRMLPMSTVMGSTVIERKDADGNVAGYTVQSLGANGVVTSRTFKTKERAEVEQKRIDRQAELNGIDTGERFYDGRGDNMRMEQACKNIAKAIAGDNWRVGSNATLWKRLYDLMKVEPEQMSEAERIWAQRIRDEYERLGDKFEYERYTHESNGNIFGVETTEVVTGSRALRESINAELGVDVDDAIRKEPNRRSDKEKEAVKTYGERLFGIKFQQEDAQTREDAPFNPDAPHSVKQIEARFGVDEEAEEPEEPIAPRSASFKRGYDADLQERRDIAIELSDPNNAEAQEAWEGVMRKINEDADYDIAQSREYRKQLTRPDGSMQPAYLKEKNERGNNRVVYIVEGNVQMMPDGSMIDKDNSDNSVVIFDPEEGKTRQIDPTSDTGLAAVGKAVTAEELEEEDKHRRDNLVRLRIELAQGTVDVYPGETIELPTGETAEVVAVDADKENITVMLADGTQSTVLRSELQRYEDEKALADYNQRHGINTTPTTPEPQQPEVPAGQTAGAPAEYTTDMELTVRDEDGQDKPAIIMGRVRYENGSFVPDENGRIVEYYMDGEVKHDYPEILGDKVVSYTPAQPQQAAPAEMPAAPEPATAEPETPAAPQPEPIVAPAHEPVTPEPAGEQPMPMKEDGEEDWQAVAPERAHTYIFNEAGLSQTEATDFINAQRTAAEAALAKAKSAQMPKVGTSIKKFNEAKGKRQEKIDEAQRTLDYWNQVREIQRGISQAETDRRAAEEALRHDAAVAAEQQRQAEELAKREEQAQRGAGAVHHQIRDKWNAAPKVEGAENEITLANGERVKGRYVLVESGAATPSHNPNMEFARNEGFPVDENGQSVNDRDYERDLEAQNITRQAGRSYDSRAIQNVPVVSKDGVVLSGNGRTMAGELAAQNNTDGAYIDHLRKYPQQFGFTSEQVADMQHPRVLFVPYEDMPYTTETFAKFNAQDMKSQSRTEQSVKLGKTVDDATFNRVIRSINGFNTLNDFYADDKAATDAITELQKAGVINTMQVAEMFDGEKVSVVGRQMLENMLIGKAFENNPDAVRQLSEYPSVRQNIISALAEIGNNVGMGEDYSLENELSEAINLVYQARKSGTKAGELVSSYARQLNLFPFDDGETVADYNNVVVMLIADLLNGSKKKSLKEFFAIYNGKSRDAAAGQLDIFTGEVKSKSEIINDIIELLQYGTDEEKQAAINRDAEQRREQSRTDASPQQSDAGSGSVQGTPGGSQITNEWNGYKAGYRFSPDAETDVEIVGFDYSKADDSNVPEVIVRGYDKQGNVLGTENIPGAEFDSELRKRGVQPQQPAAEVPATPDEPVQAAVAAAEAETNVVPTEAQKEAGNYKKGHVKIDGFDISIENPKGSERTGTDASGRKWSITMNNTYGYIRGTEGVDGDHIDIFLSDNPADGNVYVIDQVNPDGSFDEHKVMYGFPDIESARKAYLSNYEEGWQGLGAITPVSKEEFKKWVHSSHRKTKPFAEYSSVQPLGDTQLGEQPTAGYSIEPTTYTNKKGKTTPMQLVTFGRELSKDEIRAGKELAKESRGWWDREKGGFMMRDEDSAKALAEALNNEEAVQDAQPLTVEDLQASNSPQPDLKSIDEPAKVEPSGEVTEQYDNDLEDRIYEEAYRRSMETFEAGRIAAIPQHEAMIRRRGEEFEARREAILKELETNRSEAISNGALRELAEVTAKMRECRIFADFLHKKIIERKRDKALEAHGVKLGDSVIYNGKEAKIYDADADKVTLDTGMAPVLYEMTEWENITKVYHGGDKVYSIRHQANKDIMLAQHANGTVKYTFTDGTTAKADEVREAETAEVSANRNRYVEEQKAIIAQTLANDKAVRESVRNMGNESDIESYFDERIAKYVIANYKDLADPDKVAMLHQVFGHTAFSKEQNAETRRAFVRDIMNRVNELNEGRNEKPSLREVAEASNGHVFIGGVRKANDASSDAPRQKESTTEREEPKQEGGSKWVDDADAERFEELRKRLRDKLNGQANIGIDPEVFTIGVEMSYMVLKHGARKFAEFAKRMIEALGDNVRPYLKTFYNGARDLPEMADLERELTPYDEVREFDVMNFDKKGAKDVIATAEHVVREQQAEREAKEAKDILKDQRNEQRKESEKQFAANTESVAGEAATVADEVESQLPAAGTEQEVNELGDKVDDAIRKVDEQLAVLGYYEAEPVAADFNEAYGYMRNAEKKALKNISGLYKELVRRLGIREPEAHDAKGKKIKPVSANIAPAGGDITMRITIDKDKGIELFMDFMLEPVGSNDMPRDKRDASPDDLRLRRIMWRIEQPKASGRDRYLTDNEYFDTDVKLEDMLRDIRSIGKRWLPVEDYVAMAEDVVRQNEAENKPKPVKNSTKPQKDSAKKPGSRKISVSSQQNLIPDLFSGLFDEDELNSKDNDTARTNNTKGISREDGSVGRVPADRDGVLGTRSTGGTERGETARVSDETGSVADGARTGIPGQRSSGSAEGGDNLAGEAGQPLSDGGRSLRNGETSFGRRTDDRGTSAETGSIPSRAGEAEGGGKRGLAQLRGRGNVKQSKQPEPKFTRNYLYPEDASAIDNMTPQQRLKANVEALELLRTLMQEGRPATAEEREVLGRYRGWGGVELGRAYSTEMMRRSFTDRWGAPTEQGKLLTRLADVIDALDPNGERGVLSAINHAALTSYYTPTGVAKVMNRFVELAGFKGGNMLDPSMGNGIFEGTMSKVVQQRTMIHGVELDWLTGQIARNLYPDANVLVTGYQDAGTADNAYDVVMSNIPFGDFSVTDKAWKHDSSPVRKAAQNRIHNYFAVKMLDNTRPGGLCVIMTSNAILDTKGNQIIREYIADNAEVLGVVRLPDNTFKGAGTSVVTDVIFLRKYKDDTDRSTKRSDDQYLNNIEKPFLTSGELQLVNPTDGKSYKVAVNGYFTKNKGMMIGDAKAGGQYRADQFGLGSNMSTDELAAAMQKLVEKKIVGDRNGRLFDTHKTVREVKQAVSEAYKGDGSYISSGNIVEQDGMFGIVTSTKNKYGDVTSTFTEMPALKAKASRIRAMLPIRATMKELIAGEIGGAKESVLSELRQRLQKSYDDFAKQYGRLNDKVNDFLTEDIDGYQLRALERYDDGKFVGLSDIFTKNTIKPALDLSTAKTPQEAISLSLAEYGEINPAFMEDVLGESWAEQCGETLFKEPFTTDSYLTADAYLSGDVKTKLEQAREAAKEDKALERNVKALEAVQPKDIPFDEISIRMGARWIPAEIYTDFMYDMFGIHKNDWKGNKSGVEYMPEVDQYVVNVAPNELGGEADQWRTSRRSASEVFTAALEDKSLSVFDTIKEDGKEIKILNKEETELLNGKIQDLRTAFEDWLSQNPEREEALMRLYNDKFNRTVLRKFDGSHLRIPGLMGMELRPHQKDAVWMLINNRGGIVDHIVGAGKTLVMQSAIMEMRRMGIAKKPMIIGLKATVAQIAKEFREAYPAARILAPTEKDFEKKNRKKLLAKIAVNDYDCIIISHDNYTKLDHTEEVERGVIDEQMAQLDAAIESLYGQDDKDQLTKKQIKGLEKRKANLEAKLASLLDRKIDREFTFEGLGVDYLFVDECQHFKSLPYVSTYDRVAGLGDKNGSQRAIALLNGVRYLQKMHQGDRGTVFLSGTTISNSLSEIYHLLNYLRPSEMEKLGMTTFDAWAGNYAIHTAELEYGVTNELKEKDRFRSLTNIPELSKMYAEIADVRNDMNLKLPKPKMRSHIVTVPQSDLMKEINAEIVNMVRNKDGHYFGIDSKDTTPWGLLASTLSAKAAINPRLIDDAYEDEGGKIPAVCEQVKKIYDQFNEQKGTQLIFCDTGVSSKGKKYDAYSDIINRLVNDYGIPRGEIADIHIADTDEKRKALFAKVNEGSVRILIGGTKNMGTGVNVQKRIVAMHHVDVPWTPADREQREGRGVRQGNEIARDFNDDNVDVYFYATEGSLDMYKYQLQETKGKLFAQFKSGTIGERTFDEGDAEGDFDPAEVVAMLSGNPVIFEKSKQDKKVEKLRRAKRAYESDWQRRRSRYEELQTKQRNFERLISLNESDVRSLERGGFTPDEDGKYPATVTIGVRDEYSSRRTFDKPKEAGEYLHSLLKQGKKVELSGFGQKANVTVPITEAGLFGKPVAELDSYGGIKYTVDISDDDTAAGTAFRNLLQKVYTNKNVYERNLEDVKNQLRGADPGENKFPKQAELDEALKEKKRLDDEYKKLSDEKPKADEDTAAYRIREDEAPKNTGIGYKVFVLKNGKLYPPMVANPNGEATPVGIWLDADAAPVAGVTKTGRQQVKAGGKGTQGGSGKLAYRPGWHLGEIPYALQFGRLNPETGERELFPANFVWAEVEYAKDVDYQEEAMSYGTNANGKFQHSLAGLPRVPENGSYKYRTNPNPETDPWVITGAMKVNRILKPSEVDAMVEAAGREPQQRQAGAVTDEQVEALNNAIVRTMQEDAGIMRKAVEQAGAKLNTKLNIIEDVNSIEHSNPAVQSRRRKSKGWYDISTGEVYIVLPNNRNVEDALATVGHETLAHKGLREMVGEERYDEFLDETYRHLRDDLKKGVDEAAGRSFMDDATKNGEKSKSYDQHRRNATDELFGRMAEKPFEEFSEGERTLWQKIKATVRRLLDKFLGSLKLPKWFELGDNELRYILWRSKERMERGKEHPIDLARDIVKREELGLTDEARYNMGDVAEPSFASRRDRAVNERGYVHAGLNSAEVKVVSIKEKSPFDTSKKTKVLKEDVVAYANGHNIIGTMSEDETKGKGQISISKTSIEKMVDDSATSKSVDKDTHLAVIPQLREIIAESMMAETHPDYNKGEDGKRSPENGYNPDNLIHRCYGAISVDGQEYRVKLTLKETSGNRKSKKAYSYEVTKIEVLDGQTTKPLSVSSRKSNTPNDSHGLNSELEAHDLNGRSNVSDVFVSGAKLLNNFEKSYDTGKKLLDESKISDESTDLYRDPDETEDIWNDQSLGLQERITAAATRLANNHRDNKTLRDDAMRAIGGNLSDLRRVMSLQRKFDASTVKRVSDLAKVLMEGGYLNNLGQQEVKRLLSAVKNSVGSEDIEGSVKKVMDIMVDNQLKRATETLESLERIKGSKVDARGVEVQGQLDPDGAHIMKVFKEARVWEKADIESRVADAIQRMGSDDVAVADDAALDYAGLLLAKEYVENIKDSITEEQQLREEIRQAKQDGILTGQALKDFISSVEESIRENKTERIQAYYDLVSRLSDGLNGSIDKAKQFMEAEKQRVQKIHHFANSDMQGKDAGAHRTAKWREGLSNGLADTLFNPLMTFEQFMRLFGSRTADGEGYLFTHFMRGAVEARDKEIKGVRSKFKVLDTKVEELFGKEARSMGQLISRIGSLPKAEVEFYDGGEKVSRKLNQGNLMYIYMVNKMLDGRMKLRKMGITEEDVADIEQVLDPRLIEFADWLQDEFLVETRNEYNETHKRMFGASMAAIENYFPLKILGDARNISEDVDKEDTVEAGAGTTVTGAIKKRVRNSVALDITNADALHVILDHVAEMEHWNAYAEWGRDLNTLLSYGRFRNQVKNMRTIYGSGDSLWGNFKDCCRIAAGTYHPKTSKFDKGMLALARGATAAAVSFRLNTALKQLLSMPAVIPDLSVSGIAECLRHPENPWNWCMANLPQFQERWLSRRSGDPRLQKTDMGWNDWRGNIAEKAARMGMTPNAFVDALTVSIVAYSTYQTRLKQYQKDGYGSERAAQKAKEDATMSFNLSQQSSEGAYLSPIQACKDWLSTLFTIFRNASMSYTRQVVDSARNLKRMSSSANRAVMLETMAKKYVRDGIDEAHAAVNAKRKLHRQIRRDILRQLVFGWVLPGLWSLGGYWTYLLFGDDDDEKDKAMDDVKSRMVTAPLEGLTGGDVVSNVVSMALRHEWSTYGMTKDMPLGTEFERAARNLVDGKHLEALNDMINLAVQMGVGVNPKTIEDMVVGVEDMIEACNGDVELAHEGVICAARILNCPRSQVDKLYFDEIGMSGEEAKRLTPQQIVERYARMQVKQGRPLMFWTWDDGERIEKFEKKATKSIKERIETMGDAAVNEAYEKYAEIYKGVAEQVSAANKMKKKDYVEYARLMSEAQSDTAQWQTYQLFKNMDNMLDEIAKMYLESKSAEEANLCRQAILDYKRDMVKALQAPDDESRAQVLKELEAKMKEFSDKYAAMQPKTQANQ